MGHHHHERVGRLEDIVQTDDVRVDANGAEECHFGRDKRGRLLVAFWRDLDGNHPLALLVVGLVHDRLATLTESCLDAESLVQ